MRKLFLCASILLLSGCGITPEKWGELTGSLLSVASEVAVAAASEKLAEVGVTPDLVDKTQKLISSFGGQAVEQLAAGAKPEDIDWEKLLYTALVTSGFIGAGAGGLALRKKIKNGGGKS